MSFLESIENAEIQKLPLLEFSGNIHLVENQEDQKRAVEYLSKQEALGFDTESKPSFKKGVLYPVSLLQLSTEDEAFLFRLKNMKPTLELLSILASPDIYKIGVAINDDISDLRKLRDFKPDGFVPLEKYVKQAGIQSNGLRKIAAIVLNGRISKSAQVSNWEAEELSDRQKKYAATDAWAGLMIYKEIRSNGFFEHP